MKNFIMALAALLILLMESGCGGGGGSSGNPSNSTPPTITSQPSTITVTIGTTARFAATVSGSEPINYQWYRNGVAIPNAINNSYEIGGVGLQDDGAQFSLRVANAFGIATTDPAVLGVTAIPASPVISLQPGSVSVFVGEPAQFMVGAASPQQPFTYQWRRDGVDINGAVGSTFRVDVTNVSDNGAKFTVVVTNQTGSTQSTEAQLDVKPLPATSPVIVTPPVSTSVFVNRSATFTVVADGIQPLAYQWKRNGSDIPGATFASYQTPPAQLSDEGTEFSVQVSNSRGTILSVLAVLHLKPGPFTATIEGDPISVVASLGSMASFEVFGGGSDPLNYTWFRNELIVSGNNSKQFSVSPVTTSHHGTMLQVGVSNESGIPAYSRPARVYVASGVAGEIEFLAGALGGEGSTDGVGQAAHFSFPSKLARDTANNLYVIDNGTIRKIRPDGTVSRLAGTPWQAGNVDGPSNVARFNAPNSIAIDTSNNIYISESSSHAIRRVTPSGTVTTIAGSAREAGSTDGIGATARFFRPSGIAVDRAGNIFVSDSGNFTVRKITPAGRVSTFAGTPGQSGSVDALGTAARFNGARGIEIDSSDNLYVFDAEITRRITPAGAVTSIPGLPVSTFESNYYKIDSNDVFYKIDSVSIKKYSLTGSEIDIVPITLGSRTGDIPELPKLHILGLSIPALSMGGVVISSSGDAFVSDQSSGTIIKISSTGDGHLFAGRVTPHGYRDDVGVLTRFGHTPKITTDGSGNVFVADTNGSIRRVDATGVTTTFVDILGLEGTAAVGIAANRSGNLFVTNPDGGVRKITSTGSITGSFFFPSAGRIAMDRFGNVYVTSDSDQTVRKIAPSGTTSIVTGFPAYYSAFAIAADSAGNLYLGANTTFGGVSHIYRLTPSGSVTKLADYTHDIYGIRDGGIFSIPFNRTFDLCADDVGNVYVANTYERIIERITPDGNRSILAGKPLSRGVVTGPLPGSLNFPHTCAASADGKMIYVQDEGAVLRIRLQ